MREYLKGRGIPDEIINSHLLGWNGWRITIPIYDRSGAIVFFKLAKDPEDSRPSPKMLTSPGAGVELYGWDRLLERPARIIVCEGEFDRLVLEAQGFRAVTSTAGASCFRPEWAAELRMIDEVYVCFDRDQAGRNGASVVGTMVPHAKLIELPEEVGEHGDITDFFVRLRRTGADFLKLMEAATPIPASAIPLKRQGRVAPQPLSSLLNSRIEAIKRQLPIEKVIAGYVRLKPTAVGATLVGICPFHDDGTPSLTVYPQRGMYHCFGCRAHGDVIEFVRTIEHLGFAETIEMLERITSHNGEVPEQDENDQAA
jgi:DNA primase